MCDSLNLCKRGPECNSLFLQPSFTTALRATLFWSSLHPSNNAPSNSFTNWSISLDAPMTIPREWSISRTLRTRFSNTPTTMSGRSFLCDANIPWISLIDAFCINFSRRKTRIKYNVFIRKNGSHPRIVLHPPFFQGRDHSPSKPNRCDLRKYLHFPKSPLPHQLKRQIAP